MRWSRTKVSLSRPGRGAGRHGAAASRRVGLGGRSARGRCRGAVEEPVGRHAGERGGHEPEQRQGGVAAADVGRVLEGRARNAALAGERGRAPTRGRWWRRSTLGSECVGPEVLEVAAGLDRACRTSTRPGTACGPSGHSPSTRATAAGCGRVEHLEVEAVGPAAEGAGRAPRGTATSRPCRARRPARGRRRRRRRRSRAARATCVAHRRRAVEPAEPVGDLGRVVLPERVVAAVHPFDGVAPDEVGDDLLRRRRRGGRAARRAARPPGSTRDRRPRLLATRHAPRRRPRRCGRGPGTGPRRRRAPGRRRAGAARGRSGRTAPCRCGGPRRSRSAARRRGEQTDERRRPRDDGGDASGGKARRRAPSASRVAVASRRAYASASRCSRAARPAAVASGFPDSVPAWYTGPSGATTDITSLAAAVGADVEPAADDLAEAS